MPKITFIDHEGTERSVEADAGESIMEAAISNDIPGIEADCGGGCACATCHVYVDEAWLDKLEEQDDMEASMLEYASEVRPNSRLSCQLPVTEELDGLRVVTPVSQD